jgi:hypothetical protein
MRSSDDKKIPDHLNFYPFYERFNVKLVGNVISRIGISALLGFAFLALHYAAIGDKIYDDWSPFLAFLISATMLFLYYCTATLRTLISAMARQRPPPAKKASLPDLKCLLSDRNFILVGAIFGILNCTVGYKFGLPYFDGFARATILIGYFLSGFIGGMAVLGIYAVCVTINGFSRAAALSFDFTAPDGCGGTLFIGEALVVFSSVTLIAGVMISVYIFNTNWKGDQTWWVIALKYFWIVFPYILSLVVLIVPAASLHNELMRFKVEQEALLKSRLAEIRRSLAKHQSDTAQRKDLRDDYEFGQSARRDLHKMRTWPFGIGARLSYFVVFTGNFITSKNLVSNTVSPWIKSLTSLFGA